MQRNVFYYTQNEIDEIRELPYFVDELLQWPQGLTTPGWYFWEIEMQMAHGPFPSKNEAMLELIRYDRNRR